MIRQYVKHGCPAKAGFYALVFNGKIENFCSGRKKFQVKGRKRQVNGKKVLSFKF